MELKEVSNINISFRSFHPFVIFFYYLCVGILALFFNHPLFLLFSCLILIAVNLTHDNGEALKKWSPLLIGMSSMLIIMNALLVPKGKHILFEFFGREVTVEATVYGGVLALLISSILLLFISFNTILNGNKFLYIFSKFLPKIVFLTMLSIRFVPLLKKRMDEIVDVQRIKGLSVASGTLKERMTNGMIFIQILLTWSLEEGMDTADSMTTRGYGIGKRSSYESYRWCRRDKGWLAVLSSLFIFSILGGLNGSGRVVIYPELSSFSLNLLDYFVLISSVLILLFPLLVEGGEQLRWKYFN
ncbi:energy-coupling factor transporter transmembrane protein EcfT [Bacillus sp. AGMB 02131]|uniref:Energy-coupling factor transporter transmembrane protein EcfT n=1 Tax=Peribacillus faecalis TaxID=2772559 RepID=A0A927HAC1_9BACI|nr:energy-coupling factor transporter transmembrane protein EcfT [Peribacillus faecalis]